MRYLQPGRVTGLDFSVDALSFCRQRGHLRLAQASVMVIPFAAASFDLIVSFDVISEADYDDCPSELPAC
jgi:ubiquinone/menaquinone biosynthesis C-methylase UbiE